MNGQKLPAVGLAKSPVYDRMTPSASRVGELPGSERSVIVIFGLEPLLTMISGPASLSVPPSMVTESDGDEAPVRSCAIRVQSLVGPMENASASKVTLPPTFRMNTSCAGDALK